MFSSFFVEVLARGLAGVCCDCSKKCLCQKYGIVYVVVSAFFVSICLAVSAFLSVDRNAKECCGLDILM